MNSTIYRVHLFPNNTDGGENRYTASWAVFNSPTTEFYPGTSADGQRVIDWRPGHVHQGRETWILKSFKPVKGACGRLLNFHTTPQLPGGWDWGGGVSGIALDYNPGIHTDDNSDMKYSGLVVTSNVVGDEDNPNNYHYVIADEAKMKQFEANNEWLDVIMRINWGNKDPRAPKKGAVKVWLNGADTPVVDVSNTCTSYVKSYRPGSPPVPEQPGVTTWEGGYVSTGVESERISDHQAARIGRTLEEALADNPVLWSMSSQNTTPTGPPNRSSYHEIVGQRSLTEFRVPASLGGGGGEDPPTVKELIEKAEAALSLTTINGKLYQQRLANGFYKHPENTQWWKALDLLKRAKESS
jgi:hypothetical protein